jgi:hypothetical protein
LAGRFSGEPAMANDEVLRLKARAVSEARRLIADFLYLWVLLGLFAFHKALILNESLFSHQGFALVNALALAKMMRLGEIFHVGETLRKGPLIYPIM